MPQIRNLKNLGVHPGHTTNVIIKNHIKKRYYREDEKKMVTKCRKSVNLTLGQVQMDFKQDRIVDFLDFTDAAYLG